MNIKTIALATTALVLIGGGYWLTTSSSHHAEDGHGHAKEDHADEAAGHNEDSTTISAAAAAAAGIETATAGPATLAETIPLRGAIILNPDTSAEIKARFAGIIKSARATVGQTVARGETLATVESNDSMQVYAVTSPLAGVVVAHHAHVGDTAAEEPLFTVANLATVVAALHVFPQDLPHIRTGQTVQVQSADGALTGSGTVKALLPTTDADTQTVPVWVVLANPDNRWRSGMAVQAGAVVSEEETPLAVKNTALQTLENQTVVFLKNGDTYTAQPVKTGRTDGTYTEVTSGLQAGATYVTTNSFIIKADLGKSAAGHSH